MKWSLYIILNLYVAFQLDLELYTTIVAQIPINEAIIPMYESVVIVPLFFICPQNVKATQVILLIIQVELSIILFLQAILIISNVSH